jgi:hypothetical protein
VDLARVNVRLKAEFQAGHEERYRPTAVMGRSQSEIPAPR